MFGGPPISLGISWSGCMLGKVEGLELEACFLGFAGVGVSLVHVLGPCVSYCGAFARQVA